MATTVTKGEFDQSTGAWQSVTGKVGNVDNTILANFFNVPLEDLQGIISEMNESDRAVGCRVFIGSEPVTEGSEEQLMKLYFVGIDASGAIIYEEPDGHGGMQSAIYDMVMPCPPTCR